METYLFVYVTIFLVALIQIPIAVDLLRFMFPEWRLARLASKATYSILFVVMGTIFCIGLSYHLFVYLPLLAGDPLHSVTGVLHICFALWVWINVVGNYYFAVFLHPAGGHSRSSERNGVGVQEASLSKQASTSFMTEKGPVQGEDEILTKEDIALRSRHQTAVDPSSVDDTSELHHCRHVQDDRAHALSYITALPPGPKTGLDWQPKRSQYCKICQCSVPYLDHHCPFTGNCAGMRNYSNFYVGLLYGVVGLAYASAITLPYFFECNLKGIFWFFGLLQDRHKSEVCYELGAHTHIFLPVFAGFVVSSNMLFLQTIFLLADVSTYNVLKNWRRFPMLRFMRERIQGRKFLDPESRLNTLILKRRPNLFWYLVPAYNDFFR